MRGVLGMLILHTPLVKLNIKMKVSGECVASLCVCDCGYLKQETSGVKGAMPNPVGCDGILQ